MPISIKNNQTEILARKLAELTGETLTEIAMRCAARPIVSNLSADEILGYDESGVPTR